MERAPDKARMYDCNGKRMTPKEFANNQKFNEDMVSYNRKHFSMDDVYLWEEEMNKPETDANKALREEDERQTREKAAEERTFKAQQQAMPFWWRGCMEKSRGDQNNILVDIIEGQVKRKKYVDLSMMTEFSRVAKSIDFEWDRYPNIAMYEDTEANRERANQKLADDTAAKKTQSSNARKLAADKKRHGVLATPEGIKAVQELADKQAKKKKTADEKKPTKKAEKERLQAEKNQIHFDKYVAHLEPVAAAPVQTPASSSKGDGKKRKLTPAEEWLLDM